MRHYIKSESPRREKKPMNKGFLRSEQQNEARRWRNQVEFVHPISP
jgi:hypothetical protein